MEIIPSQRFMTILAQQGGHLQNHSFMVTQKGQFAETANVLFYNELVEAPELYGLTDEDIKAISSFKKAQNYMAITFEGITSKADGTCEINVTFYGLTVGKSQ